ncbi:MAG: Fur family transcriptional regulator [Bacilli bacterium]
MERRTVQRELILESIHDLEHSSTKAIVAVVKHDYPTISVGTIYRNLKSLEEDGLIRKVSTNLEDPIYEDTSREPHNHFICEECGRIFDIPLDSNQKPFVDENGNFVKEVSKTFYGVCKDCFNAKKC